MPKYGSQASQLARQRERRLTGQPNYAAGERAVNAIRWDPVPESGQVVYARLGFRLEHAAKTIEEEPETGSIINYAKSFTEKFGEEAWGVISGGIATFAENRATSAYDKTVQKDEVKEMLSIVKFTKIQEETKDKLEAL